MTELANVYEKVKDNYTKYREVRDKVCGDRLVVDTKPSIFPPKQQPSTNGGINHGKVFTQRKD